MENARRGWRDWVDGDGEAGEFGIAGISDNEDRATRYFPSDRRKAPGALCADSCAKQIQPESARVTDKTAAENLEHGFILKRTSDDH